jgi:arginine/lysine/ornithine decarboxylase
MGMDHSQAPILDALGDYHRRGDISFTPPGHKQGRGADPRVRAVLGDELFRSDVLAMNGLDDRRMSGGVLARAQELMADAVDADRSFFSTCGSSLSVKSAMLAVAGPHEKLLVSRNAHKSVVAGLIISGVEPVWVHPRWDPAMHLAHPPGPEGVEAAFDRAPDAKGMLLITPTAYGACADIRAIADVCHARDVPLIVDEAWGAHYPFHPSLPAWAMDAGADLCVTSVHKMGGGLEQGSVYQLQGDRVDAQVLEARAQLLDTTSPSVLIYAGLDGWRRQMAEHGRDLLGAALERAHRLREEIDRLPGLRTLSKEFLGPDLAFDHDPLIIVVDVSELGTNGYAVGDRLREEHHINIGLADHRRILLQLTHADDDATTARALDALRAIVDARDELPGPVDIELPRPEELELESVMLPRDAFFGPAEQVPALEAVGRIAAEMISPYPPGVPAVAPGERISRGVVEYLRTGVREGMFVPDSTDPEVRTLRVVAG